jgi:DNA-binding transcriptional LysR family regulator
VALVSIEVAQFFAHRRMTRILPLTLASRSEPYELVTRKGAPLPPAARLLIDELVRRRS